MSSSLPVDRLAAFDQAHARCAEIVDALIDAHRQTVEATDVREVCVVALVDLLNRDIPRTTCAELLAVAVDRLTYPPTP